MLCDECEGEMVPRKDVVCPSGTDTCSAPSWYCDTCYNIKYVHSDKEFDNWIEQFTLLEEDICDDKFSAYELTPDIVDVEEFDI